MRGIWTVIIWFIAISAYSQKIGYQEKLYVHISKPYFIVGETLYYTVYALNATTGEPGTPSQIAQIRVLDDDKNLIANQAVKLQNGIGAGSIVLPETLSGQVYTLLAYTNYQKNFGDKHAFIQPFPVYNLVGFRKGSGQQEEGSIRLKHHFDGNWLHLFVSEDGFPVSAKLEIGEKSYQTGENGYIKVQIDRQNTIQVIASTKQGRLVENLKLTAPMLTVIEEDRFYSVYTDISSESTLQLITKGVVVYEKALAASSGAVRIPFDRESFPPGYNQFRLVGPTSEILDQTAIIHTPKNGGKLQYDTALLARRNTLTIKGTLGSAQSGTVSISVYSDQLSGLKKPISLSEYLTVSSELAYSNLNFSEQGMAHFIQPRDYTSSGLGMYGFEKDELVIDGLKKPSMEALFIAAFDDVPLFDFLKSDIEKPTLGFAGGEHFFGASVYLSAVDSLYSSDFYHLKTGFDPSKWLHDFYPDSGGVSKEDYREIRENILIGRMYGETSSNAKKATIKIPHLSSWDERYDFNEYIDLGILEIALSQLVAEVSFKKNAKGQLIPKIEKENFEGVAIDDFEQEALVLLNGVPVKDYDQLLTLPYQAIDSAHVVQKPLSYYGWEVGGVFSVFTKNPLQTNMEFFGHEPVKMPSLAQAENYQPQMVSELTPLFLNQVFWQSQLKVNDGRFEFDILIPDNTDDLVIDIQGITSDGTPISIRETIRR